MTKPSRSELRALALRNIFTPLAPQKKIVETREAINLPAVATATAPPLPNTKPPPLPNRRPSVSQLIASARKKIPPDIPKKPPRLLPRIPHTYHFESVILKEPSEVTPTRIFKFKFGEWKEKGSFEDEDAGLKINPNQSYVVSTEFRVINTEGVELSNQKNSYLLRVEPNTNNGPAAVRFSSTNVVLHNSLPFFTLSFSSYDHDAQLLFPLVEYLTMTRNYSPLKCEIKVNFNTSN